MPRRIAVIGAGPIAREHTRAFASIDNIEVCGVFSRTRCRAEALAAETGIPVVADSIDDLFHRTRADLAVVAVSVSAIYPVALQCLDYPWALLLEKPPGLRPSETAHLLRTAKKRARNVFAALNRRHLPSTQRLLAELPKMRGDRFIRVLDQEDTNQALKLGYSPDVIRNWMYANAIHVIDLLRLYGRGAITHVDPIIPYCGDAETVVAKLVYESGDVGLYEAVWNRPGPWSAEVTTRDARFEQRPLESLGVQMAGSRTTEPLVFNPQKDFKPGFREQACAVLGSLNGAAPLATTLSDAYHSMLLARTIYHPDEMTFSPISPPTIS